MVQFIFGRSGSGKSTFIRSSAAESLKENTRCFIIVPEQQTVIAEEKMTEKLQNDGIPSINCEVLNFSRLANRVFRTFGGISANYLNRASKALIMWQTLFILSKKGNLLEFSEKASLRDTSFITLMLDTIRDFKTFGISPASIEDVCSKLEDGTLRRRLTDLSLIYSLYDLLLKKEHSDPYDDLTHLAEILDGNNFFEGCDVYVDSFTSFTPQEVSVIRRIMAQCRNTFIAFGALPDDEQAAFEGIMRTASKIRSEAQDLNLEIKPDIVLRKLYRFEGHSDLKFLSDNLWNLNFSETFDGKSENITVTECSDIYSEADCAAGEILKHLQQGCRLRDIAVIARDISSYEGIIDTALEKYSLNYFMSTRTNLTSKPQIKLITIALNVISSGWRTADMINYMKTGLAGLDADECSLMENYASTWNISGRRWYDQYEWSFNPRGYSMVYTDEDNSILQKLNLLRIKCVAPLYSLFLVFREKCTVKEACTAVYNFLTELEINKKLEIQSENMLSVGNENIIIWNLIIDALDQFVMLAGDNEISCDEFSALFSLLVSESDIGHLPPSADSITVGDAAMLRLDGVKYVFILGANDGIFPKNISDNGLFCDEDVEILGQFGLELPKKSYYRATDELMFFHNAVSCASCGVYVYYSCSDINGSLLKQSPAADRILHLFPDLKIRTDRGMSPLDVISDYDSSFDCIAKLLENKNDPDSAAAAKALYEIYKNDKSKSQLLTTLDIPLTGLHETLSEKSAEDIFGGDLALTQSRIDNYALCPFSYACNYLLKLNENKRAQFRSADIGNFVHKILEEFMILVKNNPDISSSLSDIEISDIIDKIIKEYLGGLLKFADTDKRLSNLIRRLKRTSVLLIRNLLEEFEQSKFRPEFFEMKIERGSDVSPLRIRLPDKTYAYVYGIVDRVDTYLRDGDVYVRVIDYKTGTKDFSLEDAALGINLQLMLYLFSIWQNPTDEFKKKCGILPSGQLLPAGMLYFAARSPELEQNGQMTFDETYRQALSAIGRTGLLISDKEVLSAMEPDFQGRFIPVTLKKDGSFRADSPVRTIEEFLDLSSRIQGIVSAIASKMKKGIMDADPIINSRQNACRYCPYRPVCRINL